ncbi:unnamed protein product [Danaus chrysippus]|uniref:(African queen) hypothetical protein n=1 Tax=Danaus chrysippus TaxID=151541 RepID=A0A8J2QC42_9NEOP|nr:unnamed protein product [Danaus chrysippus]
MESIPKDSLLEFNPDTLQFLRKQYNLDTPGRIEEAIEILSEWLKKQKHFLRKEFPKEYLERTIIISKGSVERAKKKLDSICTYRTLFPEYFTVFNVQDNDLLDDFYGSFLPKLTSDHYRVYAVRNKIKKTVESGFIDFYRFFLMQCEYVQAHDYCNGLIIFVDYSDANIMESVKWINISDVKRILDIMKEGYGMRIKGIHFYTESKAIDALVTIVKQGASQKVAGRIQVHKTLDKIHEYIPKDIMPVEYGGQEKPLFELHKKMRHICSTEFKSYLEEIRQAGTNESLRQEDSVNKSHYMGISGTFRNLSVD